MSDLTFNVASILADTVNSSNANGPGNTFTNIEGTLKGWINPIIYLILFIAAFVFVVLIIRQAIRIARADSPQERQEHIKGLFTVFVMLILIALAVVIVNIAWPLVSQNSALTWNNNSSGGESNTTTNAIISTMNLAVLKQ